MSRICTHRYTHSPWCEHTQVSSSLITQHNCTQAQVGTPPFPTLHRSTYRLPSLSTLILPPPLSPLQVKSWPKVHKSHSAGSSGGTMRKMHELFVTYPPANQEVRASMLGRNAPWVACPTSSGTIGLEEPHANASLGAMGL